MGRIRQTSRTSLGRTGKDGPSTLRNVAPGYWPANFSNTGAMACCYEVVSVPLCALEQRRGGERTQGPHPGRRAADRGGGGGKTVVSCRTKGQRGRRCSGGEDSESGCTHRSRESRSIEAGRVRQLRSGLAVGQVGRTEPGRGHERTTTRRSLLADRTLFSCGKLSMCSMLGMAASCCTVRRDAERRTELMDADTGHAGLGHSARQRTGLAEPRRSS